MSNEMTMFLALMDTIHDFSNTSRMKNSNETDEITQSIGSTAFLIDFLMLGLFHDKFRSLIGLDINKSYIQKETNCESIPYTNPNTKEQNANLKTFKPSKTIDEMICKQFYLPTYAERILYRSEEPEELMKDILMEYLQKERNQVYHEMLFDFHDIPQNAVINNNCIKLHLGNKGVDEKRLTESKGKKYLQNNGTIKDKYSGCESIVIKKNNSVVFSAKDKKGLFVLSNEKEQGKALNNRLKSIFNANKLVYITDENQANNKWFEVDNGMHYKGKFVEFDSGASTTTTQSGGGKFGKKPINNAAPETLLILNGFY